MPTLSRRGFLAASAAPLVGRERLADTTRPNILLILADGLGAWMCGCYGNREIRTPNIDLLARLGMRFRDAFVVTPASSPSRATLLTGRTPMQHGIQDFLTDNPAPKPPQGQAAPPPSFYVGKWHLGSDQAPGHGHRFTYTMLGGSSPYQNPTLSRNGKLIEEKGYLTSLLTKAACEFLDQQDGKRPFLLTVSYPNPHPPYDGHPANYYEMYAKANFETIGWEHAAPNALRDKGYLDDIVGNLRKGAAGVTALDAQIPVLLNKLRERKIWRNTLIVFTSVEGSLLGRHGLWDGGLASDPINVYEEVMRVPLIVSWPGKIPVEATRPELVSSYDILPTLCQAARTAPPAERNLCGRSFYYLVRGLPWPPGEAEWPRTVFGCYRNTQMARDNRFKLVLRNRGEGPNELYDLRKDPRERRNEYDNLQYVTVRDRLRRELDEWAQSCS